MEVTGINKQKFLAELGKLLTFMYEEDRQTALAMYGRMFDDAQDEQELIHELVSPTRQAVAVARSYDAKVRKLQVQSQYRDEEDSGDTIPDFVLAINRIYDSAVAPAAPAAPVLENQVSFFDEEPEAPQGENEPFYATEEGQEPDLSPDGDWAEVPVQQSAAETPAEREAELFFAEADEDDAAPTPEEEMEAFFEEDEQSDEYDDEDYEDGETATRRRAKVPLLILYVLLAVPVTLLGIGILLMPTAMSLALAVSIISGGSATLIGAFSGFPVFADLMVVLGSAIVLLALGLLCLWLFVWFIGGAMAGLVRGVIALGRRWCFEEVPV